MSLFANPGFVPTNSLAQESLARPSIETEISLSTESMSGRDIATKEDRIAAARTMGSESATIQQADLQTEPFREGSHYRVPFSPVQLERGTEALQKIDYSSLSLDSLLNANISDLNQVYQYNRMHLLEAVQEFQSHLGTFALSGRGHNDLNKILTEKRGTYASTDSIQVIGVSKPQELSAEDLLNNLCHAAAFATDYSYAKFESRKRFDSLPGGIMVLQASEAYSNTFSTKGSSTLYPDSPHQTGESGIAITPQTFDKSVRGVIPYSNYAMFIEAMDQLLPEKVKIHDPQYGQDQQFINYYNTDLYPRATLINLLAADLIVAQALTLLCDRNEAR